MNVLRPLRPDCVLALDTLGTHASTTILGITAIRFDLDDPLMQAAELVIDVDPTSNYHAGRSFDTQALQYWADRPDFQTVFSRNGADLQDALQQLAIFMMGAAHIWATGGGFETSILANAYEYFGQNPPWNYWSVMCIRTLCSLTSWMTESEMQPSFVGATTLLTARLRQRALFSSYNTLKTRVGHV